MAKQTDSTPRNRLKLAFDWIPNNTHRLLDAGCAWGYGTAHYATKARNVFGCDPNREFIERALRDHPEIQFHHCPIERTPFECGMFDAITLTDVLEHVADERAALNELFRVLKPGGLLVITTPHKGLFSFMDIENYAWFLRTKFPGIYRWLFHLKHGKNPAPKVGYESPHRHYSLNDLAGLLNASDFKGRYQIKSVFRSALLIGALASNLYELLAVLTSVRFAKWVLQPFAWLSEKDFFVRYGALSWNIGILVEKTEG